MKFNAGRLRGPHCYFCFLRRLPACCVVVEVALDVYDRCALVARARCEVAQRSDQISEAPRCGALRRHIAHEALLRLAFDGL